MEKLDGLWIPKKSNKESSWEELAFAEDDAAGSLWPPRSYTCSFCRREFRSAQALGGHMNVHRRDRARLKQQDDQYLYHNKSSLSPPHNNNKDDIRETSSYTLVFNSKTNFLKSQHSCVIDLSSSSTSLPYSPPSRASFGLPQKQDSSPSCVVELAKNSKQVPSTSPWLCPRTFVDQKHYDLYEIPMMEGDKKRKIARDEPRTNNDLSVSMNLVIHQSFPIVHGGNEESTSSIDNRKKRRRLEEPSQPSILVSSLSCKGDITTSKEGIKQKGDDCYEKLDLELRLGTDPSKEN